MKIAFESNELFPPLTEALSILTDKAEIRFDDIHYDEAEGTDDDRLLLVRSLKVGDERKQQPENQRKCHNVCEQILSHSQPLLNVLWVAGDQ